MIFMRLNVGPKFETYVMLECDVVALKQIAWGVVWENTIIVGKSINPENSVLQKMDKQKVREAAEREHTVCAASNIFQIANMPLNSGNVLISGSRVQKREKVT